LSHPIIKQAAEIFEISYLAAGSYLIISLEAINFK